MLFAIHTIAKPNSDEVINNLRTEHRAYLEPRLHSVYLGGPLLGRDGESRIGGLLVMEFSEHSEADKFFAEQPYAKAGIIDTILIHPFIPFIERGESQIG
jgi:uncharacterized protein YciI